MRPSGGRLAVGRSSCRRFIPRVRPSHGQLANASFLERGPWRPDRALGGLSAALGRSVCRRFIPRVRPSDSRHAGASFLERGPWRPGSGSLWSKCGPRNVGMRTPYSSGAALGQSACWCLSAALGGPDRALAVRVRPPDGRHVDASPLKCGHREVGVRVPHFWSAALGGPDWATCGRSAALGLSACGGFIPWVRPLYGRLADA